MKRQHTAAEFSPALLKPSAKRGAARSVTTVTCERDMRLRRYRTREFTEALQQHLHEAKQAALCDAGQPFQWGQIGGLDPQDRETRCAILQKKASDKGYQLSPEVIEFLADSIRSSARRLEGALTRVGALSMCHKSILTVPFARQLLRDVLEEEEQLRKTGGC